MHGFVCVCVIVSMHVCVRLGVFVCVCVSAWGGCVCLGVIMCVSACSNPCSVLLSFYIYLFKSNIRAF